ncbi:MAG TPA: redoxin family protein [Terriglobia bacterium]|nr:redoxin family protein [Terriglobia bacterium]
MRRYRIFLLAIFFLTLYAKPIRGQQLSDPVAKALAEGEVFRKQRDYDRALSAYRKADKLSHHTCADCFIGMFRVDRELGNLQAALDDIKEAVKAAGDDKSKAAEAHLLRSALLARMASKPNDKKLREAESEVRQVLALAPGLAVAHLNLGMILIRQERDSEGILELKTYLAAPDADLKARREARRIIADPIRGREPFAPDFSFVTLEGESLSNAALRGKVVLFDFWGTWCPVCRESLPMVLSLRKKYRDRPFQIVGVNSDEDEQAWKRFIASNHMDWPEFLDSSNALRQAFDVNAYPTFIIVDRDGVITYNRSGWSPDMQGEMEEVINKALKKPSNPAVLAAATASVPEEPAPNSQPETNLSETSKLASNAPGTGTSAGTGAMSGNVYRNDVLGFSLQLPPNWVVAAPEIVGAAAEKAEAVTRAKFLEQHPEQGSSIRLNIPKVVFYASQSGQGDGQRLSIPCVRISAMPWTNSRVTLDEVKNHAMGRLPPGMTVTRGPEGYIENGRGFLRMEAVSSSSNPHIYLWRTVTVSNGQLLTQEVLATDQQDLERLGATATLRLLDMGRLTQGGAAAPSERSLPVAEGMTAPTGNESSSDRTVGATHTAEQAAPSFHLRDIRQGEILMRSGHLQEAIAVFRQAIQSQPNDIKCHRLLANALVEKGDRAAAIVEYQEIVKLEPDNAENHFVLGAQLETRGATAGYSRDDFRPQTDSNQPGNLALPKTARSDYEAALEQYALAHKLAPQSPVYNEAYERLKSRLNR